MAKSVIGDEKLIKFTELGIYGFEEYAGFDNSQQFDTV
jgi:hypothetical protein